MLCPPSEQRLKALLVAVGDGERDLEATRQRLCSIPDFALHSAFERVDRDVSNALSTKELISFLRDNSVFHCTDGEVSELIKFFDSDGNGRLTFQEFIQMLLPCEDNVLRNVTLDRPSIRVGRFDQLPREIELAMTDVLVKEVELARRQEALKRDLYLCFDYSQMAAFRSVDKVNSGIITTVNLGAFMRENGHFASETELLAIVRRLDTDGDASVNYSEWCEFLRAVPAMTPLPLAPLPVHLPLAAPLYAPEPLPLYSRYYDWPHHARGPAAYDWQYQADLRCASSRWADWRHPSYSRHYPYYSRYYAPDTTSVTYDVEKPTPLSPARTVKHTTYHSPYGPRTYTSYL